MALHQNQAFQIKCHDFLLTIYSLEIGYCFHLPNLNCRLATKEQIVLHHLNINGRFVIMTELIKTFLAMWMD